MATIVARIVGALCTVVGWNGSSFDNLQLDSSGYLKVVNMAPVWPSVSVAESTSDTSASTSAVDLLTTSLVMPATGVVVALGGVRCSSSVDGDVAGVVVDVAGTSGTEMQLVCGTSGTGFVVACARVAVAAGTCALTLRGRRVSGTGTVTFDYKWLCAVSLGA